MATRDISPHRKSGRQKAFLKAFAEVGNVSHASDIANIDRKQHYRWLEDDDYVARFEQAKREANDALEREAWRRAVEGIDKPVGFYQGAAGERIKEYSDTLLIFLMKGAMPDKYRERTDVNLGGQRDNPINVNISIDGKPVE